MALAEVSKDQQKLGPGLSLNLNNNINSNNPFLNPRTGSPAIPSPSITGPLSAPITQPKSNNPFLASFETEVATQPVTRTSMEASSNAVRPPTIGDDAKEMFKRLTVADDASIDGQSTTTLTNASPRRKPVGEGRRGDDKDRRPSRSDDTQYRRGPNGLRIPIRAQPTRDRERDRERPRRSGSRERRARRTSDGERISTEEERREREKRRRERDARNRDRDASRDSRSEAPRQSSSRKSRKNAHVDVVDKLDVTGLYGVGGMWHHDGPFDACRPVRNNKKNNLAPMNAFPANSANNTIGGSGPVNAGINLQQFHGLGTEGFHDYGALAPLQNNGKAPASSAKLTEVLNPINRVEPVHGEESLGLGTSTFLDGAPASRAAIQRTQSEQGDGFLTRKKSIAMRLRGMSGSRRYPEGYTGPMSPPLPNKAGVTVGENGLPLSPEPARPATAGARTVEKNPFDSLAEVQDEEYRPDTSSAAQGNGGKFLNRVKSLKGPRRRERGERSAS